MPIVTRRGFQTLELSVCSVLRKEGEVGAGWRVDRDRDAGFGVVEVEFGGAEYHPGVSKLFGGAHVLSQVAVEIVADDGVAGELEVLADLMIAPGVRGGFDDGEFRKVGAGAVLNAFEVGECGPRFFSIGSAQGSIGLPVGRGLSIDDGAVFFCDEAFFKEFVCKAQAGCGEGEEQDAGGGAVEAVDGMDFLSELIAQDFHGDLIVRFGGSRLVDENPSGFVDGNESIVLVKNLKRVHLHSA